MGVVRWDVRKKGVAINKIFKDTNLTDKHNRDYDKKHTWPVTVTNGLSRNCKQTETLKLTKMPT